MATLVTGGTGFIGSNIVRDLAERGHEVVSLDILPVDDLVHRNRGPWAGQVTWIQGDIVDPRILEQVAARGPIDNIIHNATYTPYGSIEGHDSRRVFDINLVGTVNLLDLARQLAVHRFLYISSAGVYQEEPASDQPLGEDKPLKPRGIYGVTKYASEGLTARYGQLYGFETASMRLAQNWGPMERVTPYRSRMSLPYEWVGKAVRGELIQASAFGHGITEGRRFGVEHPYARDTAAAVSLAVEAPSLSYPVYNISTGHRVSLHEMISAIREAHPEVKFADPIPEEDASEPLGPSLDVTRMVEDLGFVPRYDLVSGLRDYIEWRHTFQFMD